MDAYIFQADLYCSDCAEEIRDRLTKEGNAPEDPSDEYSFDSDDFPKGPYGDGGGESDSPQHCAGCNVFLENPLTEEGTSATEDMIIDSLAHGRWDNEALRTWLPYYDGCFDGQTARAFIASVMDARR